MKTSLQAWAMLLHAFWCGRRMFHIPHVHVWRIEGHLIEWEELR